MKKSLMIILQENTKKCGGKNQTRHMEFKTFGGWREITCGIRNGQG